MNWKSFWESFQKNWMASSILSIAVGLILLFFPGGALKVLCYVIGAAATAMGVVRIVQYFRRDHTYPYFFQPDLTLGLLILGLGIFTLTNAKTVISLIPAVFGVMLIGWGVGNILRAVDAKRAGYAQWGVLLGLATLTLILGWVIVSNPFATVEIAVSVIGAGLVFEGVTDIVIVRLVGKRIEDWRIEKQRRAEEIEEEL